MLAVNNTLPSKILPSPYNLELVAVKIYSKYSFILCLIYNPPNSDLSYFFNLLDYLNNLLALNNKIILLGDFNLPDINWESLTGQFVSSNLFCDIVFKFNLSQFVNLPTHIHGNILDLILSNDSDLVKNIIIHSTQYNHLVSDHYMITFSIPCNPPSKSKASSHYVLNFSKADWNGLSSYLLDYDFSPLYVLIEPDAIWSFLKQIITSSSHLLIPKIKINTSKGPKWFSSDIRHDLNCIHTLRRMFKKLPTSSNHLKLTQAESHLQAKMLLAKSNYEFELVRAFTNKESCKIYNYIRSLSRHNMLPPTMYLNSIPSIADSEKASLFNQ